MKVLIIEDEKAAARNLTSLLAEIDPSIEVEAMIDSVIDSVEWLIEHSPELIFMDIHLADGSAFDIFERCTVESPVIFTTAYDEYALKAFKVNSIDYLLKPISGADLRQAIGKFSKLRRQPSSVVASPAASAENLENLLRTIRRSQSSTTHLLLPKGGNKLVPLSLSDVVCFYIEDSVVWGRTTDHHQLAVPHTLDQLAEMVDPTRFFRANRQFLITREDITDIELWFGSRLSLRLKSSPSTKIIINKPRVSEFKTWFSGV